MHPLARHGRAACAILLLLALGAAVLSSCALTRTETDYYTITVRDTTFRESVRNAPATSGEDNGVVFPSSRVSTVSRHTLSYDSTHDRHYPNFLRAGGLETVGLMGTTSSNGLGPGLFGIFNIFSAAQYADTTYGTLYRPADSAHPANGPSYLFKGFLWRLMPYEAQLHWFNEAPNWTIGWSAMELLAPDENRDHWFTSVGANVYVRRRFYLRDRIPYVIFAPFLGVSAFPSAYANLGGELQLGSYAGMNIRAYAGLVSGFTWSNSNSTNTFPYLGLGISVLDFTNRVEETEREWKEYVHSGINVNIIEASLLKNGVADSVSLFNNGIPFQGLQVRFASTEYPLPILNHHFWAGTTLINYMGLSFTQQAIGILPIRVGYRQYLIAPDLMLEPFAEYNYYPSQFFNAGLRLKLDTYTTNSVGLTIGYTSGNSGDLAPRAFNTQGAKDLFNFSMGYAGVTVFLGDWNFTPEEIDLEHATEH